MRKKGFTLAELLGVLVIIALLLILIIPGVINRLSSSSDKAKETENEIIYNAADQYIREHPEDYPPGKSGRYCITIQSLIDDGKLAEPVIDVNTGENLSDKSVMVTIYSTGNTDHEIKDGAECEEIAALPMIDFIVEPNGSSWVKQRKVTIVYPKVDGDYEASHRIDRDSWIRDSSADEGGNIEIVFTKISELEARLKGNNIISSKIDIINVDSEIPVITKVTMGSWDSGLNGVSITAKDEISGINGLFVSTSNVRPKENDSGWISVSSNPGESKTFVRNLDLGTYYVWVKDKAGNISANGTSIKVADTTKPTCSIKDTGTKGNNNWYKSNVNLTMTTSDKESGVASYGMNTSNNAVYNGTTKMTLTYDTKSQTYYGFVRDRAGNVGTCSKNVKRDIVAPSCSIIPSGQKGNNDWYTGNVTLTLNETDATSGVVSRGLTTSSSVNYNGSKTATRTADTSGLTYYGYVRDDAGNTGICSNTIKRDATKPTINCKLTLSNGSSYKQGTWSRSSLKGSVTASDATSKVSQVQNNKSGSWKVDNSAASYTLNEGKHNYSFRAIDNAGNVSNSCSINGLVDITKPWVCKSPWQGRDPNDVNYTWRAYIGLCDNLSGIEPYDKYIWRSHYCYHGNRCGQAANRQCENISSPAEAAVGRVFEHTSNNNRTQVDIGTSFSTNCGKYNPTVFYLACDAAGNCMNYYTANYYY